MVTSNELPEVGQIVEVAWGLQTVRGRVLDAAEAGLMTRVTVELLSADERGGTVTVPAYAVSPVADSPRSSWKDYRDYEAAVKAAIERIVAALLVVAPDPITLGENESRNFPIDMLLSRGARRLGIEVKKFTSPTSAMKNAKSALDQAELLQRRSGLPVLVVTSENLPMRHLNQLPSGVAVQTWRDERDDGALRRKVAELLLDA